MRGGRLGKRKSRSFSCESLDSFSTQSLLSPLLTDPTPSTHRSATIDPTLFTNYFKDPDSGMLAPTVEVPGQFPPISLVHFSPESCSQIPTHCRSIIPRREVLVG